MNSFADMITEDLLAEAAWGEEIKSVNVGFDNGLVYIAGTIGGERRFQTIATRKEYGELVNLRKTTRRKA